MRKQIMSSPFLVSLIIMALLQLFNLTTFAQTLSFPEAEGFGRYATGGRGGSVYHVTNLNDSGTGSFRDAVSQSNRIVVFDVGGVINISSRIVIHENVTVAGQTAPGGGITIYGNGIALNDDSGNNIIRYIRIRMGKNGDSGKDAVGISAGTDYMFDHVSISWGRDGTLDVNGTGIDDLSFQECIISQGINNSNHSTGGLMQSGKWSMLRSLYIDNKTRNPKARGTHEFINSVLYNWATNGYIMGDTEGTSECNLIGNYFIYGPSSSSDTHITGTTPTFYVYPEDNWVDSDKDGTLDGSLLTNYKTATVMSTPYNYPGVNTQLSAQSALSHVINNVGASLVRDEVDELLINQVLSYGTSGAIINTEDDNGITNNVGTVANGSAPLDSDQDGMPDAWETANGMNPSVADDSSDNDNDGYTNIEEYINWIPNNYSAFQALCVNEGPETAIQENETGFCGVDGTIDSNNAGYTGSGFANTTNTTGSGIDWYFMGNGGTYTLTWRYANGGSTDRAGTLIINNNTIGTISLPSTGSWTTWNTVTTYVALSAGYYDVRLEANTSDGLANIDYLDITGPGATIVECGTTGTSITIQENETGFCSVDGTIDNNNAGYTGDGFANTTNATGNGVDWSINFSNAGTYTFTFQYASATDRPADLIINGSTVVSNLAFPNTGSWTVWNSVSTTAYVSAGTYDVRLEGTTSSGLGNIDYIMVTGNTPSAATCSSKSEQLGKDITEANAIDNMLNIIPNPNATEELMINAITTTQEAEVSIYTTSGSAIFTKKYKVNDNQLNEFIDISKLSPGVYIVRVSSGGKYETAKLIRK